MKLGYTIIKKKTTEDLIAGVNEHLAAGWKVQGSLQVLTSSNGQVMNYLQAMTFVAPAA